MAREAVRRMRRDERPDLQDDLIAVAQNDASGMDAKPHAVAVDANRAAEAEEPTGIESPAPDGEDAAEGRATGEADDPGGIERPDARAAARDVHAAGGCADAAKADARRYDDDPPIREDLEMRARPGADRRGRADGVHG